MIFDINYVTLRTKSVMVYFVTYKLVIFLDKQIYIYR